MDQSGLYNHWQHICAMQEKDFRADSLNKLILRILDKNNEVLDVGCGACGLTLFLLRKGFKVISIDTSDEMLGLGRRLLSQYNFSSDSVYKATISEFSAQNQNFFEQIVCLDVIEHIEDDIKAISELTAMLKVGGRLIMTVPAIPSLYGPKDIEIGHYRRYDKERLQKLFDHSSCTVDMMRYWNFIGVPVTWFYLNLLNRPVNESMRKGKGGFAQQVMSSFLWFWFSELENRIIPPVGLTLLVVAEKKF